MRKHHIALCCAVLMGACAVAAAPLTPGEALSRVRADRKAPASVTATRAESYKLAKTQNDADGIPAVYLFATPGNDGYLLLSADDAAPALLGYSDSGAPITPTSTATATLPPQLEGLMEQYGEEIAWLRSNGRAASHPVIRKDAATPKAAYSDAWLPIAPLLKDNAWGPNAPYNSQTPMVDGNNCSVGYGALAAGMVMSYHKWPEHGFGPVSCTDVNGGIHTMSLNDVKFDWDHMPAVLDETSSDAEIYAVSSLLKAVGYAARTEYGRYSSSAHFTKVAAALKHQFNYDAGISIYQMIQLGLADWNTKVYENLAQLGPVIISDTTNPSNMFVCDGYSSEGFFHFNWGWDGETNGYFRFSALDPFTYGSNIEGAVFSIYRCGIFGIERPNPSHAYIQKEIWLDPITSVSLNEYGTELTVKAGWFNLTPTAFGVQLGAYVTNDEVKEFIPFYIESNCLDESLSTSKGWREMKLNYNFHVLPDGYNLIELVWRDPQKPDEWHALMHAKTQNPYVVIRKEKNELGKNEFKVGYLVFDTPAVVSIDVPEIVYNKSYNHFQATLYNPRKYAITSYLTPLITEDYTAVTRLNPFLVHLEPGEFITKDIYYRCDLESVSPDSKYHFFIMDDYYWTDLNGSEIVVEDSEWPQLSCSDFNIVGNVDAINPDNIEFTAVVKCEAGHYTGPLEYMIYYVENGVAKRFHDYVTSRCVLHPGDSETISFSTSIPEQYRDKEEFICGLYHYDTILLGRVNFSLTNAAVEEVVADEGGVGVSYDAASGRVTAECEEGIDRVEAYSASGALLGSWRAASGDTAVSADLSAFPAGLTIVVAHSRAGETRAVKIPR